MKFVLRCSWNVPGITITGVDYGSWPSGICSTYGDYNWPPLSCYQIGPIDSTYGVFSYGYATFDSLAPAFSLTPSEYMDILFSIPTNGCIDSVKIESLSLTYVDSDYTPCVPEIDAPTGFPLCGLSVKGLVTTENGDGVKDVTIKLEAADTTSCSGLICTDTCALNSTPTGLSGSYGFCNYCTACNYLKVTPYKNDNPLNGLTTYDLVLISKHILGIDSLGSPYKMIAADANKSRSITTFDIVELRKLILGIYDTLPGNTSWRFVDKAFSFPNPSNPFFTNFPEQVNCITPSSTSYDFYAIKVGDVNYTAALNRPAYRPLTTLTWPLLRSSKNGYITVPVSYSGVEPLEALQFGLRFDPSKLQLMATTKGEIESYNNQWFNNLHADEGEIKTLWLSMSDLPDRIKQGNILFYLTFKVLDNQYAELPLWFDDQLLEGAAWTPAGAEYALGQSATPASRESSSIASDIQASIRPNPADHTAWLEISASKAEKARVALYDASGKRIFMRAVQLSEGKQEIALPEVAALSAGVYVWKVITPRNSTQGHLIKQ